MAYPPLVWTTNPKTGKPTTNLNATNSLMITLAEATQRLNEIKAFLAAFPEDPFASSEAYEHLFTHTDFLNKYPAMRGGTRFPGVYWEAIDNFRQHMRAVKAQAAADRLAAKRVARDAELDARWVARNTETDARRAKEREAKSAEHRARERAYELEREAREEERDARRLATLLAKRKVAADKLRQRINVLDSDE